MRLPIALLIAFLGVIGCSGGGKTVAVQGNGNFQKPTEAPPPLVDAPSGFVALDSFEQSINSYLESLPNDQDRQDKRFLVGCDQINQGLDLTSFEQGVNKGINMMSTERRLAKLPTIGKENCIYVLDMSTFGLTSAEWNNVVANRQLNFVTQTIRGKNIQALTQTQVPYMFADDFFLTVYEGDAEADKACAVWCDITEDPRDLNGYYANQGIVLQNEVNNQKTIMAAFGKSQIALGKNRVVEMVENDNGWCMSTYDTSLAAQENAFVNPFTIEMANALGVQRSQKVFKHDAQEHICELKNGMFGAFRLNGAGGGAEVKAPNNVVVNTQFAGVDPTIRNVDCAACHHTEIAIGFQDQVGATIQNNNAFNEEEKRLGRVFYNDPKMAQVIQEINQRHSESLRALDITDTVDPFNNSVIRPFRQEMDATQVASKVFMPTADFLEALKGTSRSSQKLGNLIGGGTVSLGTLKGAFADLVRELNLYRDQQL